VTVLLPCLDEAGTVADCVDEAFRGLEALGRPGEVLVVDNGSSDGSADRARERGARVIREPRRGYGCALGRGIREAEGEILLLADADGSYPLDDLGPLLAEVEKGADLAIGSRLRGTIEPGAMPWLHRRIGTPFFTRLINILFGTRISDVHSGMRALRASSARALDLRAAGMEFASEMVIKAALLRQRIAEAPIRYRPDRRGRPSHLRRFRDGWRHLRFILLFAPNVVLVAPGLLLFLLGAILGAPAFLGGAGGEGGSAWFGALLVLLGAQAVQVGLLAMTWYHVEGFYRRAGLDRLFRHLNLEKGLLAASLLFSVGVVAAVPLAEAWRLGERLPAGRAAAALTFLVLGGQGVATSLLLSVLGIRRRP
jgi:glycosyltransferase involved in cell wall biosynthesis